MSKCKFSNCGKRPSYNFPEETKRLYCSTHKSDGMIAIGSNLCLHEFCYTFASFNLPGEKTPLYCLEHKTNAMVNVKNKNCLSPKCKEVAIYGLVNKRAQFCYAHKEPSMINLELFNKCTVLECDKPYDFTVDNIKYCVDHCPDDKLKEKKACKYCDMKEDSKWICSSCNKIKNKKEWAIVRYLRKAIDTPFEYNSSKILQGCSKKRPDIYFELATHCVIVEVDEFQHKTYEDSCECSRINEIVNGIGGKPIVIIRYNPDNFKNKGKTLNSPIESRLNLLVKTIKTQLVKIPNKFSIKLIQLFYDDDYLEYKPVKKENITKLVSI